MTLITGTFKDSGQVAIASGVLRVQLNTPLADTLTTPDSYLLTIPSDFVITNGVLATCDLKESETAQVSYTFSVFQNFVDYDYYYAGSGDFYATNSDRPSHLYSGSYYTGVSHTVDSLPLERIARTRLEPVGDAFQAIVPNQSSVDFAQLERTGFATDRTPQTARQIARILLEDPLFMQSLINFLVLLPYSNTQTYRKGNIVQVGGSSYQCLVDNTTGQAPPTSPTYWGLLAAKGDAGGTGGNDSAWNSATWDGDLNAPSKNAVRDILVLLAPLASPTFTGTPAAPTAAANTNTTQIATTANVVATILARLADAALTGNPTATTQINTQNDTRLATTAYVKNVFHRYSRMSDVKASGTAGGAAAIGVNTRDLNTIDLNAGDIVTLTSNTFTLRPGTYRIMAQAPANQVNGHRIFLWNVTSSTRTLNGSSNYAAAGSNYPNLSYVRGTFTIASNTDFQIRHYCEAAFATSGLGGRAGEASQSEIYTIVELWRLD